MTQLQNPGGCGGGFGGYGLGGGCGDGGGLGGGGLGGGTGGGGEGGGGALVTCTCACCWQSLAVAQLNTTVKFVLPAASMRLLP